MMECSYKQNQNWVSLMFMLVLINIAGWSWGNETRVVEAVEAVEAACLDNAPNHQ